ncbi:putative TetR-family transcriptional regulator [Nostocoides japonicum T1-X7]|uniref:Putative TetR-family transcriptional regulator n=1 Tax=Nostocoides japonicum T1-X7 TaxID=1194083 RepID=A0A077M0Q9_9MICO|nr:TetR/AcrR family transcriptional regulator [Tetrasphaera japonica]CCH79431.1 putative TetR-family transcriptional regulator [Tetrasphaera japonica T1-X7]
MSTPTTPSTDVAEPRRRRKPGTKPRLSRQGIIEAAFAVSERDGAQALTFQAIGAQLGAHPTAIYRYFRDKDELLLALLDAIHAEALAGAPEPTDDWAADLAELGRRTYAAFLRHPQVAQFAGARTARRENEFRKVDRVVGCMRTAGFEDADAARYYRVFSDLILAHAALDASLAALDPATRAADLRSWDVEYRTLPADLFPDLAAVADHLPRVDDPGNFELAMELMLDALRMRAAAARSRRRPDDGRKRT